VICGVCALPILEEDEDDPDALLDQSPPICGECARARNFDELLWEADTADGRLDGELA
jgi:hypothetical protein